MTYSEVLKKGKSEQEKEISIFKNRIQLISGIGIVISILLLIILEVISLINPVPITRQAEDGSWYVGFIAFVEHHNLYSIVYILFMMFLIAYSIFSIYPIRNQLIRKSAIDKHTKLVLAGYLMIFIGSIILFYEVMMSSFFHLTIMETILLLVYIVGAVIIQGIGNKNVRSN